MTNPTVFISYSWDNEAHNFWVLNLAQKLRDLGVDVILDKYEIRLGHDLLYFMEQSVSESDKVLLVLTPNYKLKAEKRQGGVGYEYSIISSKMYDLNINNNKFIPILKEGNKHLSVPAYFESKLYLDMTDEESFDNRFEILVREIYEAPELKKPSLGVKPSYVLEHDFYTNENSKDLEFFFIERHVTLVLEEPLGKLAICHDKILMKIMKEVSYYEDVFTNDGYVENIKTAPGIVSDIKKESGNVIVKTKFDKTYQKGELINYSSSCYYIDSHENISEYFTVWSGYPTKILSITVAFPDERQFKKYRIFKMKNKSDRILSESLFQLKEVNYYGRKALQVIIEEPDLFDKYKVEWEW